MLGGPTPLWVSSYTSYLLYKVQSPFSACRQSHGQNTFSVFNFKGGTSLCFTDQNSGRECAWWTNCLVGQFLHQVSLVQSSRSIQRMQTVPWPKHFLIFNFKGGPVFALQTKTQEENVLGGPTPLWVSSYTSYLLYKVQGPFSTCRQSHGQNTS